MLALAAADVESLVERAKQDPEAFGALYDRHFDQIYRFAYSRLRDATLAEDLTSEVFFKALKNIRGFQPRAGGFAAWLYRIAQNAIYDHYRKRQPRLALNCEEETVAEGPSPADEVEQLDGIRQIWALVDRLPKSQRTATVLRFHEDLTIGQIADRLGRSSPAVKQLIHRAVCRLRAELAGQGVTG